MNEGKYEGWSNYETQTVRIWIDNEQSSYVYWREQAASQRKAAPTCQQVLEGTWTAEEAAKFNLADQLEEEVTNGCPLSVASLYTDLLNAAFSDVNWQELAEEWLSELSGNDGSDTEHSPNGRGRRVVPCHARTELIKNGALIDVSETAEDVGISIPTALTAGAWKRFVKVPEGVEGQDEKDRLWAVLNMFYCVARRGLENDTVLFDVLVKSGNTAPRPLAVKAVCAPGDSPELVLTIMLPEEGWL